MGQIVNPAIMQGLWEKTRGSEEKKTPLVSNMRKRAAPCPSTRTPVTHAPGFPSARGILKPV
jgi:hypothetical protein